MRFALTGHGLTLLALHCPVLSCHVLRWPLTDLLCKATRAGGKLQMAQPRTATRVRPSVHPPVGHRCDLAVVRGERGVIVGGGVVGVGLVLYAVSVVKWAVYV